MNSVQERLATKKIAIVVSSVKCTGGSMEDYKALYEKERKRAERLETEIIVAMGELWKAGVAEEKEHGGDLIPLNVPARIRILIERMEALEAKIHDLEAGYSEWVDGEYADALSKRLGKVEAQLAEAVRLIRDIDAGDR